MWSTLKKYRLLLILSLVGLTLIVSCSASTEPSATGEKTAMQEVTVSMPGAIRSTISITDTGKLLKRAQFISPDGNVGLSMDAGTVLLDENKAPLQSIAVAVDPIIPVPPEKAEIIGIILDIQPEGANINPALKLTLSYDPSALPQGVNENDLWVYNFTGNSWEMVRNKNIDTGSNRVTTSISRFGKYSVLAPTRPIETSSPTVQPGLTSITITEALKNGKPTLAEFGRGTCIPCKEMKPILESLAVEYQDRLNVPIVSIDDYRDLTNFYKIMAIPTQIGFDATGKEIFRHVGFWPKEQIIPQLSKLGIK